MGWEMGWRAGVYVRFLSPVQDPTLKVGEGGALVVRQQGGGGKTEFASDQDDQVGGVELKLSGKEVARLVVAQLPYLMEVTFLGLFGFGFFGVWNSPPF